MFRSWFVSLPSIFGLVRTSAILSLIKPLHAGWLLVLFLRHKRTST